MSHRYDPYCYSLWITGPQAGLVDTVLRGKASKKDVVNFLDSKGYKGADGKFRDGPNRGKGQGTGKDGEQGADGKFRDGPDLGKGKGTGNDGGQGKGDDDKGKDQGTGKDFELERSF